MTLQEYLTQPTPFWMTAILCLILIYMALHVVMIENRIDSGPWFTLPLRAVERSRTMPG